MNSKEFIALVHIQVAGSASEAVIEVLRDPPGTVPSTEEVELARWFNALEEQDKTQVRKVVNESVGQAVFNFLTMLDGVTRIDDDDPTSRFELTFVKRGVRKLINDPTLDLHKQFCAQMPPEIAQEKNGIQQYDVNSFDALMRELRIGDGLDLHHVPDKSISLETIENYNPESAPAIALKKGEHRKLSQND